MGRHRNRSIHSGSASVARVAIAVASLAAATGCSSPDGPSGMAPCESVYQGQCGTACTFHMNCPDGQYCGDDRRCTADCAPGAATCGGRTVCDTRGRCVAAADAGTSSGDGGTNVSDGGGIIGDACAAVDVQLTQQAPTLLLLIDQSGSMNASFGNTNRWNAIRRTLVDPDTGVVKTFENQVRFGLALYTSHNGNSGGVCPILRPPIAATTGNFSAIASALNDATWDDDTPTGESVRAATEILRRDTAPGLKAIVLATDGEPDTCTNWDPDGDDRNARTIARQGSVDAVRAAQALGIRTYVISVGSDVAEEHLQDLANAGTSSSTGRFYRALDPTALGTAFREIAAGVRSCTFSVNGTIAADSAGFGDVRLDGMQLNYNDPNGWRLASPNQIELVGTACDRARNDASSLTARFPCGVVAPG